MSKKKEMNWVFMAEAALQDWNSELGLSRKTGPGHTAPVAAASAVHSFPETFIRLAIDAQMRRLDAGMLAKALRTLSAAQVREHGHPLNGCLRWYFEESEPVDTNASFFIGLTLLILERGYGAGRAHSEYMEPLLRGLQGWFQQELEDNKDYYPNKALGDLVCSWLLAEHFRDEAALAALTVRFRRAIHYWRMEHWGWGEHLSQVYTTVMLTEISALLLLQRQLPPELAVELRELGAELLRLQDYFHAGPWTPAIRCYAFDRIPGEPSFREQVRAWDPIADADYLRTLPEHRFMRVCFGSFFHERGWHKLFPASPPAETSGPIVIPCIGGITATACKAPGGLRLGSLSRYPLREEWDEDRWGLSWQSFPVAAACVDRLWAFPQWRVCWQDGTNRCHPAHLKSDGYLRNALVPDGKVFTGCTEATQEDMRCSVRRTLPAWHPFWHSATDGWNLLADDDPIVSESREGTRAILEVAGSAYRLVLSCEPPSGRQPHLVRNGDSRLIRWELPLTPADRGKPVVWSVELKAS